MKKFLITLLFLTFASAAVAATGSPAIPDPSTNPVLANVQKMGAKLFYLGNRDGLDGWFIVKNGQVQIAYTTPDNKGALIGAMFGQDGENITVLQVSTLMQNNKEVADLINAAKQEQSAISQVGSPPPSATPTSANTMPSMALSPGERLIHELANASTVVVGNTASPEILMVMDPNCPHCRATWKALHDSVSKGSVHLRMIPIGAQGSDNERAAAMLLSSSDALNVWDKYVSGDASALAGTPSDAALAAVRANHATIDNWHIKDTPYLVYRAKDGKVKIVQGEPEKLSALFSDLGL